MTNNLRIEQYFSPQYGVRTYYFRPNNEVRVIVQWKAGEKGVLMLTDAQAAVEIEHMATDNGFQKM